MKVSIITATFNSANTVADCVNSIHNQSYRSIEHIVIDGLSGDNTLEIINRNKKLEIKIISEKDNGIYDAMNKGIKYCTGDIVGILNSDDFYLDEQVISKVVAAFQKSGADSVYGDLVYVNGIDTDKQIRYWKSGELKPNSFLRGWMPPHPAFFVRKSVYDRYGGFNTVLKSAADYEIMLRFLYKYKITHCYLPEVLVKMRVGGKSNKSIINRLKANREDRLAWKINGLKPKFYTLFLKPLSKILQFIS